MEEDVGSRASVMLAEELRLAGLPLSASGVLAGGTSAAERAALEAIADAMRPGGVHSLARFLEKLRAVGLAGLADAVRPDGS